MIFVERSALHVPYIQVPYLGRITGLTSSGVLENGVVRKVLYESSCQALVY